MADQIAATYEKLLTRVDGLVAAVVTDRDGVVLVKAVAPNSTLEFSESALGCTFTLASEQASKLGLSKCKSIISIYGVYQVVQFNHAPLMTTFVATSSANTGLLLELGHELESVTEVISAALKNTGAL